MQCINAPKSPFGGEFVIKSKFARVLSVLLKETTGLLELVKNLWGQIPQIAG